MVERGTWYWRSSKTFIHFFHNDLKGNNVIEKEEKCDLYNPVIIDFVKSTAIYAKCKKKNLSPEEQKEHYRKYPHIMTFPILPRSYSTFAVMLNLICTPFLGPKIYNVGWGEFIPWAKH